jgi:SsrA-binding protein
MAPKVDENNRVLASNRQAGRDYELSDTYECGIVLQGSEVKALRESKVQLSDAYARVIGSEAWLIGLRIAPYSHSAAFDGHGPERDRKLLLHRAELDRLRHRTEQEHVTLVPLSLYLKDGRVKVEIAVGRGRHKADKRQAIAKRDADREAERAIARAAKYGD